MGKSGTGSHHPLPDSEEARHDLIPESVEREKGRGDDASETVSDEVATDPNGEPYPAG